MGGFDYLFRYVDMWSETTGVVAVLGVVYVLINVFYLFLGVAAYVLQSLSMHTIANRRGIRHGWLAWIPVCSLWILGSISDQYQYVVKGKIKNRRKVLLGLSIGLIVGYFLWLFITLFNLAAGKAILALLLLIFGGLAIIAATIWLAVCRYMAHYDLYKSSNPDNAVLYLVLSIVFPVTMPFFVFACRKKDGGMPPRKKAPVEVIEVPAEVIEAEPEVIEEGFAQPEEFEDE